MDNQETFGYLENEELLLKMNKEYQKSMTEIKKCDMQLKFFDMRLQILEKMSGNMNSILEYLKQRTFKMEQVEEIVQLQKICNSGAVNGVVTPEIKQMSYLEILRELLSLKMKMVIESLTLSVCDKSLRNMYLQEIGSYCFLQNMLLNYLIDYSDFRLVR